jgi:hypothetical protein
VEQSDEAQPLRPAAADRGSRRSRSRSGRRRRDSEAIERLASLGLPGPEGLRDPAVDQLRASFRSSRWARRPRGRPFASRIAPEPFFASRRAGVQLGGKLAHDVAHPETVSSTAVDELRDAIAAARPEDDVAAFRRTLSRVGDALALVRQLGADQKKALAAMGLEPGAQRG